MDLSRGGQPLDVGRPGDRLPAPALPAAIVAFGCMRRKLPCQTLFLLAVWTIQRWGCHGTFFIYAIFPGLTNLNKVSMLNYCFYTASMGSIHASRWKYCLLIGTTSNTIREGTWPLPGCATNRLAADHSSRGDSRAGSDRQWRPVDVDFGYRNFGRFIIHNRNRDELASACTEGANYLQPSNLSFHGTRGTLYLEFEKSSRSLPFASIKHFDSEVMAGMKLQSLKPFVIPLPR